MYKKDFKIIPPKDIYSIYYIFKNNGYELYLVGGCVRDSYLGLEPKDWDLVTDAHPDTVISLLMGQSFVRNILETGKAFGVVNVITQTHEFEIATMREESDYDGRRPKKVSFTNLETDLKRRDFTLNALAYDLHFDKIIDPYGGLMDLETKHLKAVGNPFERFREDKLRILRGCRFAGRFNMMIDEKTAIAMKMENDLSNISKERIRDEFIKGLKTTQSIKVYLEHLKELGLFKYIFGDLIINETIFIDVDDSFCNETPEVLIARLLKLNDVEDVVNTLKVNTYTLEEVKTISFMLSLLRLNSDNFYILKKKQLSQGISSEKILNFFKTESNSFNLISNFVNFELTIKSEEVKEMFNLPNGPELGKKIQELETNKFKEKCGIEIFWF